MSTQQSLPFSFTNQFPQSCSQQFTPPLLQNDVPKPPFQIPTQFQPQPPNGFNPNPFYHQENNQPPFHPPQPYPSSEQTGAQTQQQLQLNHPLPSSLPKEPSKIKFNERTYDVLPKIYDESKIPNDPTVAQKVTDLIAIVLKYGIPALEAKLKIKITSLNGLKIIKEVGLEGSIKLIYRKKKEVKIDNFFELKEPEKKTVCLLLNSSCSGCHIEHDTIPKIYDRAIEMLQNAQTLQANTNEKQPSYSTELTPLNYDSLPQSFKEIYKNYEIEEKTKNIMPENTQKKLPSEKDNPYNSLSNLTYTKEELKKENIPSINEENNISFWNYFSQLQNLPYFRKKSKLPKWKDYLLNGIIRLSDGKIETIIPRSIKPIKFTNDEVISILNKMINYNANDDINTLFNNKEKIFIKRLLLLIKKIISDQELDNQIIPIINKLILDYLKNKDLLDRNHPLINNLTNFLQKINFETV